MAEAIWAEFEGADAMVTALRELRSRGHTAVEGFSPFAVPEAFQAFDVAEQFGPVRLRWMVLPWIAFVMGILGGTAGFLIQWFANAFAYPQNAGGRPAFAIPSFIFNTFESVVLAGSVSVFLALFLILRLPRLWDPHQEIEGFTRTTDDRFGVLVSDPEPWLVPDVTVALLRDLGAADVRRVEIQ